MIGCTAELVTANKVACRAHAVIRQLLGCASFWEANAASRYPVREVLLDDDAIRSLEKQWAATRTREFLLIIPHMFYLPLLRLSICNLKQHAPALMERTCLYIDYSRQLSSFDLVRRAYLGERTKVLRYLTREGMPCVDTGRQLFMENVISLAAYMSPAQCLVFKDDDFLLAGGEPVAKVVTTLREGALLSGMYTAKFDRLHTCFFGMRSEALRDHLALFDNGENTYASTSMDTGSITYQSLREVPGAVRSLGDYAQSESGEVRCGGGSYGAVTFGIALRNYGLIFRVCWLRTSTPNNLLPEWDAANSMPISCWRRWRFSLGSINPAATGCLTPRALAMLRRSTTIFRPIFPLSTIITTG